MLVQEHKKPDIFQVFIPLRKKLLNINTFQFRFNIFEYSNIYITQFYISTTIRRYFIYVMDGISAKNQLLFKIIDFNDISCTQLMKYINTIKYMYIIVLSLLISTLDNPAIIFHWTVSNLIIICCQQVELILVWTI